MAEVVEGHGLAVHELNAQSALMGVVRRWPPRAPPRRRLAPGYFRLYRRSPPRLNSWRRCLRASGVRYGSSWLNPATCASRPSTPDLGFVGRADVDWIYSKIYSNNVQLIQANSISRLQPGLGREATWVCSASPWMSICTARRPAPAPRLGRPALHGLRRARPLVRTPPVVGRGTPGAARKRAGPGGPRDLAGPGACGRGSRRGSTLTLDLTRHVGSGRWRLLRIHDALQPLRKPESA